MRTAFAVALALLPACAPAREPFRSPSKVGLPAGFHVNAVVAGDFDGNGAADLALAGESQQLIVLLSDGKGRLTATPPAASGEHPSSLAAADLDGDGHLDLVVANHDTDHVTLLSGDGKGGFTARRLPVRSAPHPHSVAVADLDGDRRPDVVVDSWAENRVTVLAGGDGWRAPGTSIEVGRKPYWTISAADLDGDGHVDLVVPNEGRGTVSLLLGDGRGRFAHAPGSPLAAGPAPFAACISDVDGDQRPDVLVANYSGHADRTANDGLTWIRNDGGRRFTPFSRRLVAGRYTARIVSGDVDGDGFGDVAFPNTAGKTVTLVYGSRGGPGSSAELSTMPSPHAVALADFDRDGKADLAVASATADEVLVFFSR